MPRKKSKDSGFGKRLTLLMQEKGMGVRKAAGIAGVAPGTITNWRTGEVIPDDFLAVKKLAKELGCTLSWLLTGENDYAPEGSTASVTDVFDVTGEAMEGFAKISIQWLTPKNKKD